MRVLKLEHFNLHWREDGDPEGAPIVFANSLGTDMRLWDDVLPHLPIGLRLIRFDKRGHGLSSCPLLPFSMDDLSGDVENLLDHLGIQRCIFVGVSIGGMIGQRLAVRRPDLVQALVLSNTATKMGEAQAWFDRIAAVSVGDIECIADVVMQRWFAPKFLANPEMSAWRKLLTQTSKAGYLGCCSAIASCDLSDQSCNIQCPTLVIAGAADHASPPSLVKTMADIIPNARFHVMDDVGHLPSIEDPIEYSNLLAQFFKEIEHA